MKRSSRCLVVGASLLVLSHPALSVAVVKASPPPPAASSPSTSEDPPTQDPTASPPVQRVQRPKPSVGAGLPGGPVPTSPSSPGDTAPGGLDPFGLPSTPQRSTPMAVPPRAEAWQPPETDLYDPENPDGAGDSVDPNAWRPPRGVPGSGLPREATSADPSKLVAPLPRRPRDAAESAGLAELEGIAKHYKRVAGETEDSLRTLFLLEADAGKQALLQRYNKSIEVHLARSRSLRAKAIARYEDFLKLHPDDASWTPEISFRLAELHFEAANERLRVKEEAWEKQVAAVEEQKAAGKPVGDLPVSPKVDYSKSVALFGRVAGEFPRYTHNDAARYMMGLLLYEQEDYDAGRQALLSLVCSDRFAVPDAAGSNVTPSSQVRQADYQGCTPSHEDSKFAIESWLRVGEMHYDVDELGPAEQAYAQAAADPENKLYNAALIRWAWTLYLRRNFANAVERFDEFIRYADSVKGSEAGQGAAEYRDEAVRYLAKCYVEEDWDIDGERDRVWGIKRLDRDYADRKDEPHVPEIYAALGGIWAEDDDLALAVNLWEQVLRRWPNSRRAPQLRMRLFEAYSQMQEREQASKSRDLLATNYLRGTEWYYANEDDTEAIEEAMKLAEDALVAVAVSHHEKAQSLRVAGDPGAQQEYEIASRAYAAYLERFPDTDASYEYRFQYADTLYFSERYIEAAQQFAAVRDSNLDNRLQADASSSVLASLESYAEKEEQGGRFSLPEMPKQGAPGPFDAVALPPLVAALQEAYDRHVAIRPDGEDTPAIKFKAAALSQRYYNFDKAEPRFFAILEEHCDQNVSINAGYAIIDSYIVRGDLANTREWTEKLAGMGCGEGEAGAKFAGDLKIIGNAVRFKEANILFEEGKFEMAADRYLALVDEAPDDPDADRALNNAAVAYEKIGRFSSASATYTRIYTKYPDSEFADDALLRTGLNHARFFEFDEAVKSYLRLAEDARYEDSEHRLNALKNAANLLDGLQDYARAAELHRKYADKTDDEIARAEALFRAAKILGKTKDHKRTIAAYQAYLRIYASVPDEAPHVVESYLRIGIAQAALGKRKLAEDAYRQAVGIFASSGLKPASDSADLASEAQFRLAEYALNDVLAVKLTGTGKKFEKQAKQLFDKVLVSAAEYDAVFPYRRIEWVLAAMFRRGYAFETVAQKVRAAPIPAALKEGSESWFAYKELVDQQMSAFEDKAVMLYEETVKRSREFKISNEWTQRARERLNVYKPDEYPLLRPAAVGLSVEDRR